MNYSVIAPKIVCNACSHVQWADAKHCSACGISFVFGEPNGWESQTYTSDKTMPDSMPTRGVSPLATATAGIIEVSDEIDLEIDKHFKELHKKVKKKRYKLVPIKDEDE